MTEHNKRDREKLGIIQFSRDDCTPRKKEKKGEFFFFFVEEHEKCPARLKQK